MKTKLCGIVLALAGLTSSFGCATQTTEEVVAEAEALTLAEVELESGSVYEFFSLGEGDLAVLTRHPSIAIAREAPSRASDERLVDFYTRLNTRFPDYVDAADALYMAAFLQQGLGDHLAEVDVVDDELHRDGQAELLRLEQRDLGPGVELALDAAGGAPQLRPGTNRSRQRQRSKLSG